MRFAIENGTVTVRRSNPTKGGYYVYYVDEPLKGGYVGKRRIYCKDDLQPGSNYAFVGEVITYKEGGIGLFADKVAPVQK